jgi:hypothetical protein
VLCTDDACVEPDGCTNVPNHGNCPAGSLCRAGLGCEVVPCAVGADCQDPFFCNGSELCQKGTCAVGAAPTCEDFIACTVDSCDEANDTCAHVADDALCSDGLYCNGTELCTPPVGCTFGPLPPCGDENDCTEDLCDDVLAACLNPIVDHDLDGFGLATCGGTDCNDENPLAFPGGVETCGDGADEDCNGLADCNDAACANDPSCEPPPPPLCVPAATIDCGTALLAGANDAPGSSDLLDSYGGACGLAGEDGPEYVYAFAATTTGLALVFLDGLAADLDLFVLDPAPGGECDADTCLTAASGPGVVEAVVFAIEDGQTYWIAVDGAAGAVSSYTLYAFCSTM